GDDPLWLVEVQPEGGRRMRARARASGVTGGPNPRLRPWPAPPRGRRPPAPPPPPPPGRPSPTPVRPGVLPPSGLAPADRRFVTDLVYGTTRMRRACDFLADRFLARPVSRRVRNALRLGAYQLVFAGVPAHAAVGETVAVAPRPARGLVNAVLRRVAESPVTWPGEATRLSVPG